MKDLPGPDAPFSGTLAETVSDSIPDAPAYPMPPPGAPNVLVVLLDDVGFGHSEVFGGPIRTPTLQRLADDGVRYNNFHTTGVCAPTRAALLTGRNHHAVGYGNVVTSAFPGYNWAWRRSAVSVAEVLRLHGYATAAFGKWHNTPNEESSPIGPFDRWPTSQGFEHFYGFVGGDTNHWSPTLWEGTAPVTPPGDDGYHLTEDLADRTIAWIASQHSVTPHRPFFAYLATGACHSPHHVPAEFVERYRGRFDHGWDEERRRTHDRQVAAGVIPADTHLTPRPEAIPAWDDQPADHRQVYARMQEVYAGFLEHTDEQIGRVVDAIDGLGLLDDTLVLYVVGDNGPSGEGGLQGALNEFQALNGDHVNPTEWLDQLDDFGGPSTYLNIPVGWAWAGSTPFQWMKQVASHYGATRNPLVVSWPKGVDRAGTLQPGFHHVVDIAPTILEAAGIEPPQRVHGVDQQRLDGASLLGDDPGPRTQYFEVWGNRAIYHDGWLAGARSGRLPWEIVPSSPDDEWELYDVASDFSQAHDLVPSHAHKLAEMQQRFHEEADRNNVFPLDHRLYGRPQLQRLGPSRREFTYYPGTRRIPQWLAPNIKNRSYVIEARLDGRDASGVLVAYGGRFGGFVLRVAAGVARFEYNYFGQDVYSVTASRPFGPATSALVWAFTADGANPGTGGVGTLSIDGDEVGTARIERTIPYLYPIDEGMSIGADEGTPVTDGYEVPAAFDGVLHTVRFIIAPGSQADVPAATLIERNG